MVEIEQDTWNIKVPKTLNETVNEAVSIDSHISKAEFVRSAVREKLEGMGFTFVLNSDSKKKSFLERIGL